MAQTKRVYMISQTLTYKDTEVYSHTLTVVRMILSMVVANSSNKSYPLIVFLFDNSKNRKYLRDILDESLRSIPLWLGCGIRESSQRRIDFKNGFSLVLEIDPINLKGLTYSSVFYLGSERKFEKFRIVLNNNNKNFTTVVIKEN